MNILHTVELYSPSQGGMQEVVKRLSETLVQLSHSVTVATSKLPEREFNKLNGVTIKEFDIGGNFVKGVSGDIEKYQDFVRKGDFDIVTNFAAQQWATDAILPILSEIKAKKVFVPTGFSALYNPLYKEYFENMKGWIKEYDMNVFLSNDYRDINFARMYGLEYRKIKVIPNGASANEFSSNITGNIRKKLRIPQNCFLILLVGSHTGAKGHIEAMEIFKKARIKNTVFLIVANSFERGCTDYCKMHASLFRFSVKGNLSNKKLIVTSLNRKETVSAYKEANLFLFPSKIECSPIVLFEACASKTPFLTTDVGNSREIIEWTQGGMLLPTKKDRKGFSHVMIDESTRMLEKIRYDQKLLNNLAEKGYMSWKKKFTWERIANQYESLYKNLL